MSAGPPDLQTWLEALDDELGTEYAVDEESMRILLDLARDAAHQVVRPAAPLSTFLVGVAVGRGASLSTAANLATELAHHLGGSDQG